MYQKVLLTVSLLISLLSISFGQTTKDYAVQLTATTQASPAQVTLKWPSSSTATGYTIYRKLISNTTSWGNVISSLPGTATSYIDNNVSANEAYEYQVIKNGSFNSHGYICVGLNSDPIHYRGKLLLLVDSTYLDSCSAEINVLMKDISRDGWSVLRKEFGQSATDVTIKNYIINTHSNNSDLEAVLIVGHLAVPYSGDFYPDGHTPQHYGAWAADAFYADVNGIWTDNSVNRSTASRAVTKNIPGDGKWDQSQIASDLELQVARIDLSNMPEFGVTEYALLRSYLNKDHQYKTGQLSINKRALIDDDQFKVFGGEAFSANGWRNFSPLVGDSNISEQDMIPTLNTDFYQWAYGCGPGSYNKCTGVGTTTDIANNKMNSIFIMLFGSYFGDWDNQNNFLRAPLCAEEPALASMWAGRPNFFLHHMALGENLGYSLRLSQNNSYMYEQKGFFQRGVHTALMGDLTLRTDFIRPASNLTIAGGNKTGAQLSWTASPESGVVGYYIYCSDTEYGKYELKSDLISGTSYTDSFGIDGNKWYMVRAVKLQQTPSGTYYNLSLGVEESGIISYAGFPQSIASLNNQTNLTIYPNPADNFLNISYSVPESENFKVFILDITGRAVYSSTRRLEKGQNNLSLNIKNLPEGQYLIKLMGENTIETKKWLKTN